MSKVLIEPWVALRQGEYDFANEKVRFGWTPRGLVGLGMDVRGVQWYPFGGDMDGPTMFAHVHPIRQGMCMTGPYCQVCGKKIFSKYTPFVLNHSTDPSFDDLLDGKAFLTTTPPTCESCQLYALMHCPHLSEKKVPILSVRRFRVYGIYGDYWETPDPERVAKSVYVSFNQRGADDLIRFMVAKQLVVQITHYRVKNAVDS